MQQELSEDHAGRQTNRRAWTLRKGGDAIRCVPQIIGDRINLRIESTGAVAIVQRCADGEQADAMSGAWRAVFESRGWTEQPTPARVTPPCRPSSPYLTE
jgi:hypothetical protein